MKLLTKIVAACPTRSHGTSVNLVEKVDEFFKVYFVT